ncbi:MAG: ABC transporter ATP-binding protein [Clostridia bacterium]|nr:ABC transporter ATP-binding protein [Clostridia bacterium]
MIVSKTPLKDNKTFGTKWKQFWIKIGNYLTLSATGTNKQAFEAGELESFSIALVEFKTYKDMMLPDGETTQTDDMTFILTRGGIMLLLTVAACACAILAAFLSARLASEFSAIIRSKVFGKVETFSLIEFDRYSTSSLITRSTNDVNQIQQVFLLILRTGLIAPITLIGGFIMAAEKSLKMTSVLLYDIPILVIASVMAAKVVYPLFQVIQKKVDKLTLITREGLTGIRVVRAFNKQETENIRFNEVNQSLTKTAIAVNRWCAVLAPLIAVVMNCSMVGVVWIASKQIAFNEDIDVGDMMAVIQYMTQIMMALVMLATVFVMFPRATASALRINEILATEPELKDPETPNSNYTSVGSVKFENVNFKYSDEAENYILSNINFHAEKGKVTAIVGGTGSGKSSVINLIPRFYDATEGRILVDGVDVREIPQDELRLKIGFIPQRSVLFSGTIRENLMYGKEDATDEDCWEALEIAQSDTFVREKEGQLDARVEQGGGNFSGGQKQRLAIARAIIRRPEVLVFDDSFSALDFRTDKNLRTALKRITSNSATIIVAQRIGTIMDADNIIVLDAGKIVGQGTHEYLIRNCDVYRDIALSQMSEEELGL